MWKKLLQWTKKISCQSNNNQPETVEKYVIAKCIGCGQCAQGCPVRVKIKVKK